MGDVAFPVAFELAKLIKQGTGVKLAPRAIAEELKRALQGVDEVSKIEVAGAGYLNIFLDRASLLAQFSAKSSEQAADLAVEQPKKMVEHTSINPNKAAHIGHVRNAVLGDTFVRVLQAAGDRVEVQNYIDNTGVQVADVVVGSCTSGASTSTRSKRSMLPCPLVTLSITTVGIFTRKWGSSIATVTRMVSQIRKS